MSVGIYIIIKTYLIWVQTKEEELPDCNFTSYQPTPEEVDFYIIFVVIYFSL